MGDFDAELYLRLVAERELIERAGAQQWWDNATATAAAALVAVGVIDRDRAEAVVDDYTLAYALRHEGYAHHRAFHAHAASTKQPPPPPPKPRRVVPCDRVLEHKQGTLHVRFVSLSDDGTQLSVIFRRPQRASRRHGMRTTMFGTGGWGASGPPTLTVADDRGTTTRADFGSGHGSDDEWLGSYETRQPLATDAAWIEIDGDRIELNDEPSRIEVRIEPVEHDNQALAFLWRRLATADRFHHGTTGLEGAIEALVAAGALSADDPELADVRTVLEHTQQGAAPRSHRAQLPEPWQSVLGRRRRRRGPSGTIVVGAVTPPLDGISLVVTSLDSSAEGFAIDVEATGLLLHRPFDASIDDMSIAWWARDDRDNYYLGQTGGWSSSGYQSQGTIEFGPLDPEARRLDLLPTAATTRCVISIPLEWQAQP